MVVLAAINVSQESADVVEAVSVLRQEGKNLFENRLRRAVREKQLPTNSGPAVLNTLLEGMSIEAKDRTTPESLRATRQYASRLLPCGKMSPHNMQPEKLDDRSVLSLGYADYK